MNGIERLDDVELLKRTDSLAKAARTATVEMLVCLAEIRRRELHLALGHASLFDYCVRRLRLSEGAAGRRVCALKAVTRCQEVLTYLADGTLNLGVVCRLEPYIRCDSGVSLLSRAAGLDRRGVDELVAELAAEAARRASCDEPAELPPPDLFDAVGQSATSGLARPEDPPSSVLAPPPPSPSPAADRVVLRAPGLVRFSFEAPIRLRDKLERVGNLLSYRLRSRRLEELVEALADEALRRFETSASGRRAKMRSAASSRPSRRVPLWVRRHVRERDAGRCAYRAQDGTRCAATRPLQYDHVTPWAMGGRSDDPANIRLLCRAHNLLLARRLFPAAREAARRGRASREDAARPTSSTR